MSLLRGLVASIVLAIPVVATAQTQASATQLAKELREINREMEAPSQNLIDMARAMSSLSEIRSINTVLDQDSIADEALSDAGTVAHIFGEMTNQHDKSAVLFYLKESVMHATKVARSSIQNINLELPSLSSPAAASEAAKLRDSLERAAQLLDTF